RVRSDRAAAAAAAHAGDTDAPAEAVDVVDHVRRAAQSKTLRRHAQHRHRRLRRDALDLAPDEAVEHQIPDHENAAAAKLREQREQSIRLRWQSPYTRSSAPSRS